MATDRTSLTSSEVAEILTVTASERRIDGRSRVLALDRIATPTLNMMRKAKGAKSRAIQGGFKTTVKSERAGTLQFYSGRDYLTYDSFETMFDLSFSLGYAHMGDEWVHQIFKEAGIDITPGHSADGLPKIAASTWEVVVNLAEEKTEDLENNFHQALNLAFWRSNSADAKAFTGIDGLFPITSNSTGSIGGKSRTDPLLRHQLRTALTIDNIELSLSQVVRACNKTNGMDNSRVGYAACGESFFDKLKDLYLGTSTRAGKIDRNWMGEQVAKMAEKIGVGIPDDTLWIPGVGLLALEPCFERLDALDAPAIPWSKRCYLMNLDHVGFRPDPSNDGKLVVYPNQYNQLVTRVSVQGDYTFTVDKPNAFGVLSIA